MKREVREAFAQMRLEEAELLIRAALTRGADPYEILDACQAGMAEIGSLFDSGEYYLGELILAAEAFKRISGVIEPHFASSQGGSDDLVTVLLATPEGDVHDLGKNLFGVLLRASGFAVRDLGTDVGAEALLRTVAEEKPAFLGLSMLMTTGIGTAKNMVAELESRHLRGGIRVMIGGGVTSDLVRTSVGADFQTTNATDGVNFCRDHADVGL